MLHFTYTKVIIYFAM
uniref:Uncharacterized protein n=1 Tax=Arundo donax TaxID=35708 RepID=A0A0A9AME0_ARUDO